MFGWGILSTAKIGREQLIPAIVQSTNGFVAGIASRDLSKAQALAKTCGAAKAYGTYEALLDDPEIDGVYIPLHTSGHVEWTLKAAQAGKHVLCEKPIAMRAEEIDALIAVRDEKSLVISEAFMVTYHPQWYKVRELIAAGAIGKLKHVDGAFSYFLRDENNMRNRVELGGGALRDIGVYPTVTTRFVTGEEPKRLRAKVEYDPVFGTDIYSNVEAEFDDFTLTFYLATQMAQRQTMVFHGDLGFIEMTAPFNAGIYDQARVVLHTQDHGQHQVFNFKDTNHYQLQAEEFVRATKGQGAVFSLESSKQNQRLIDGCFEAGKTGDWVKI